MQRDQVIEFYKRAVSAHKGIEIKGAKTAYTSMNGNMFSFVDDENRLCLRFSEERKAEFNAAHGTGDVVQYGAVMRGYVALPDALLTNENKLKALFAESLEFAATLKPKASKKKT
ncbi:MAG: TfoX/Sxy family protein [Pseudomonadota bacterium]